MKSTALFVLLLLSGLTVGDVRAQATSHDHAAGAAAGPDDRVDAGLAAHVGGLREIDPQNPPPGSSIGRALAYVGDAYVSVVYGRPFKRGRVIFGGLVGYDQIWPAGAHYATEITFTKPVQVDGHPLDAGTYALLATPGPERWTVHFNRELGMHLADGYRAEQDALVVEVAVETMDTVAEQHTIDFEPTAAGMDLRITWDQTRVRVPLRPAR